MAVKIRTAHPDSLLAAIRMAIQQGRVRTWSYSTFHNTGYFSHTTTDGQWQGKAWLKPRVEGDLLILNIVPPKNAQVSSAAYAVYHGRFIEMLLAHFNQEFSIVWSTALPADGDVVS